jgi:aminopeptidase
MDPRVQKLAHLLVNYSLKLKKGQLVKIQGEPVVLPLIEACFREALQVGAYPYTDVILPRNQEAFLKYGSDDQFAYINPVSRADVTKMDAFIHIWGSENTRHLSGVHPDRQAKAQAGKKPLREKFFARIGKGEISWVGTLYPSQAEAQDAGMSLTDYTEFVFGAGHLNARDPFSHWKKIEKELNRLRRILKKFDHFHVEAPATDLRLRAKGRDWIPCHGTQNFPDGEIFTSPLEDSMEGVVRYSYPAVYIGREVEDVRLEFKKGKVVSESAARNQDYLTAMLNMDKGARRVGEFAIGTNYDIKQFTRNILFDEKIGGTCHVAVGNSIEEAGGKNKSSLHWDMVCDLRKNSRITADGTEIYRNGKFVI